MNTTQERTSSVSVSRMPRGVAFFGGGSGGHLFPGVAVAEECERRFSGCAVTFFRSSRSVDGAALEAAGYTGSELEIDPPSGRRPVSWLRYVRRARAAQRRISEQLHGHFDLAFGLGGYASLPGVFAARRAGIPVVLLEPNSVAGRVTRLLAPLADAVVTADPRLRLRGARRIACVGNPVRRAVVELVGQPRREGRPRILIAGGSQGARGINRRVIAALDELQSWRHRISIVHVAGAGDEEEVSREYERVGWVAQVHGFAPDFPRLLADADVVLCRAGATTLAEAGVLGVPAVLVPYPHHRDAHQHRNADRWVQAGAARLVEESNLDSDCLGRLFHDLVQRTPEFEQMRRRASGLGRRDAARSVVDLSLELWESCRPGFVSSY